MKIDTRSECTQLYHQHLLQCLSHCRFSIKICWVYKWVSDSCRYWPAGYFHLDVPPIKIPCLLAHFSSFLPLLSQLWPPAANGPSFLQLTLFPLFSTFTWCGFSNMHVCPGTPLPWLPLPYDKILTLWWQCETFWICLPPTPVLYLSPHPPFLTYVICLCLEGNCVHYCFSQGHALLPLYMMSPWLGIRLLHLTNSNVLLRSLFLWKLFLNSKTIQSVPPKYFLRQGDHMF